MLSYINRLEELRVADAMSQNVVCVTGNSTMAEAADTLTEARITGAPVVNEYGQCIGILSGSDFIHHKAEELDAPVSRGMLMRSEAAGSCLVSEIQHDLVRNHMSTAVQTIAADSPLLAAARYMCGQHIHRLVVVDGRAKPIGVITSLDLVASLVAMVEE